MAVLAYLYQYKKRLEFVCEPVHEFKWLSLQHCRFVRFTVSNRIKKYLLKPIPIAKKYDFILC